MNKKITILQKPLEKKQQQLIDSWVTGKELKSFSGGENEARFTVILPENLYLALKVKAAQEKKKLKEIFATIAQEYLDRHK